MSLSMANAVSLVKLGLFPTKADEPRIDPHPRRTNPGSTASEEGETMARSSPPKADEPRIDPHPRGTNPGSTASEEGETMAPQFPTQGGRTPDRPPPKADEPRIDRQRGGEEDGAAVCGSCSLRTDCGW